MARYEGTYGGSSGSRFRLYLDVTQESQSAANNTTTLRIIGRMYMVSGGYNYWNNNSTPWSVTVAGQTWSGGLSYDLTNTGDNVVFLNTTKTVSHGVTGGLSVSCSASHNASNSPYLTTASCSGTFSASTINRRGYISAISSNFIINSGFNVTPIARSNGLTYTIETWNAANNGQVVGGKSVSPGASRSITYSTAEQNNLYNHISSANGTNVTIRLATLSGSTLVGTETKTILCKPQGVNFSIPSSFNIGTAFNLTVSPNASVLYHTTGIAINGSWISGYPVTMSAGTNSRSITTSTDAQKFAIMGIDTSKNSFTVQIYTRQYNASGKELGLVIKNITANLPNISIGASIAAQIIKARNTITLSGNITTIDNLAYSLNGGSFITLSSSPGSSYAQLLSGLSANTAYTIQFRAKNTGTNFYNYSSAFTFRTLALSTLAVDPTTIYVDDELSMTTSKASGVTNRLNINRLIDGANIYSNSNAASGTIKRTLTDADFEDGALFDGQEYLTIEVVLDAYVGSDYQHTLKRQVIVYPNGVMYVLEGGTWKRYYAQVRESNAYKRAIPHIRVSNAWQKAKS